MIYYNFNDIIIIIIVFFVIIYILKTHNTNEDFYINESNEKSKINDSALNSFNDNNWINNIPKINKKVYFDIGHEEYLKDPYVGRIELELFFTEVPLTCYNFYELCRKNRYKNCLYHRIVPGFIIQSGDITNNDGTGGTSIYGDSFNDENFKIKHDKFGILSQANSGPNTNSSQFFITLNPAPHLDGKHVAFGKLISGANIVREISRELTDPQGKPARRIYIIKSGVLE